VERRSGGLRYSFGGGGGGGGGSRGGSPVRTGVAVEPHDGRWPSSPTHQVGQPVPYPAPRRADPACGGDVGHASD
jgi:hypothetical protein